MQKSKRRSGSAIIALAWWSSTVIGSRNRAFGVRARHVTRVASRRAPSARWSCRRGACGAAPRGRTSGPVTAGRTARENANGPPIGRDALADLAERLAVALVRLHGRDLVHHHEVGLVGGDRHRRVLERAAHRRARHHPTSATAYRSRSAPNAVHQLGRLDRAVVRASSRRRPSGEMPASSHAAVIASIARRTRPFSANSPRRPNGTAPMPTIAAWFLTSSNGALLGSVGLRCRPAGPGIEAPPSVGGQARRRLRRAKRSVNTAPTTRRTRRVDGTLTPWGRGRSHMRWESGCGAPSRAWRSPVALAVFGATSEPEGVGLEPLHSPASPGSRTGRCPSRCSTCGDPPTRRARPRR